MATEHGPPKRSHAGEPRDPYARESSETRADVVGEALKRARRHGSAAAFEGIAMLQALIEAAALASGGRGAAASGPRNPFATLLEGLGEEFARGTAERSSEWLASLAAAVDSEIAHWETRARDDTEARTVLRAFLGLREVLWEFGVKREPVATEHVAPKPSKTTEPSRAKTAPGRSRVQRIRVEG